MIKTFRGRLFGYFETGLEGVLWSLQRHGIEGYDGLIILESGDSLEIYSEDNTMVFSGIVRPNKTIGLTSRGQGSFSQQSVSGIWVHWVQNGVDPEQWADFFMSRNYTGIVKRNNEATIE